MNLKYNMQVAGSEDYPNICYQRNRNCLPFQSTWVHFPVFIGVRVARLLVVCALFCRSLFFILSFFILSIVLSVLLPITAYHYLYCIFKIILVKYTFVKIGVMKRLPSYDLFPNWIENPITVLQQIYMAKGQILCNTLIDKFVISFRPLGNL